MAATITVGPAPLNFSVRKGSTLKRSITWYEEPVYLDPLETEVDPVASVRKDLTGWTARMQVRDKRTNTLVYNMTTKNGRLILGGGAGTIVFYLEHYMTDYPEFDKCKYDLEMIDPSGMVVPLIAGSFTLPDQVTDINVRPTSSRI